MRWGLTRVSAMTGNNGNTTTRYAFPTEMVIGIAPRQGLVSLTLRYKLSPDEPEEFQQHYALTIEQATTIANSLLEAVQELSGRQ